MTKRERKMQRITSIEQLKSESLSAETEFALLLNYGLFSRKTIRYDVNSGIFSVWHHIDDTQQSLTEAEVKKSNIGLGIRKGAFVKVPAEEE